MVVVEEIAIRQDWLLAEGVTTLAAGPHIFQFCLLEIDATKKTPQRNALCDIDLDTIVGTLEERHAKHHSGPDQPSAGQPIKTARKPAAATALSQLQNENGL